MSLLTNQDVIQLQNEAIIRVAKCLKIDTEHKSMFEIFDDISKTEDPIFNLLDNFIVCYRQYQNFHFYLDIEGVPGNLLPFQRDGLAAVITNRDNTRNTLIAELQNRGC